MRPPVGRKERIEGTEKSKGQKSKRKGEWVKGKVGGEVKSEG